MHEEHQRAAELMKLIGEVERALIGNMREQASAFGLSVFEIEILRDVADHPGTSLLELQARLGQAKSSVSRVVNTLVSRRMLLREVPPENRRTVRLRLNDQTEAGELCRPDVRTALFKGGKLEEEQTQRLAASLREVLGLIRGNE